MQEISKMVTMALLKQKTAPLFLSEWKQSTMGIFNFLVLYNHFCLYAMSWEDEMGSVIAKSGNIRYYQLACFPF